MKQFILAGLVVFSAGQLYAQPVITRNQYVTVFTDSIHFTDPGTIGPGASGANVTWDFSDLPPAQAINVVEAGNCPGSNNICTAFPAANAYSHTTMVGQTAQSTAAIIISDQQVEIIGGQNHNDPVFTHSDRETAVKFPVTYGQTFTDRYAISTGGVTQYGTKVHLVDAYGTVITPAGTFTDVLRTRTEVYDTSVSVNGTIISTGVSYSWGRANQPQTIIGYVSAAMVAPVPQPLPSAILYGRLGPVAVSGVKDKDLLASLIDIYPNPAVAPFFQVKTNQCTVHHIRVTDLTGKAVYSEPVKNGTGNEKIYTVGTAHMTAGMYLVAIATDKGTLTKKIIIR